MGWKSSSAVQSKTFNAAEVIHRDALTAVDKPFPSVVSQPGKPFLSEGRPGTYLFKDESSRDVLHDTKARAIGCRIMYDQQRKKQEVALLKGVKVLLVEDEPDMEELLNYVLQEHGAEVISVQSADEAIDRLGHQQFDVIISNLRLPDHDGQWLIQQIRQFEPALERIPAVAITSYDREFNEQFVLDAGFDYFFSKFVEPNKLARAIVKLLRPR